MPIVIARKNGEVLSAPKYTPAQKQKAWETIVQAAIKAHPELLIKEEKGKGPE